MRYSIGFGKVLISRKRGQDQTEYCLSAIPLGGYVQLLDERSEDVPKEQQHRAFNRQSATKRIFILFAGPLANFLFAIVAYIFMFSSGIPGTVPLIGDVEPQSIAWQSNIRTGDRIVNVGDRVYFAYDSFELDEDAKELLQHQAAWLKQYSKTSVIIEGHCDERGTREYNLALGEKRAQAVKNYLSGLGVDTSSLSTISYGKERPAVVGSTDAAWSQNRRSVTTVN